jgi:hypothetical protein
MKQLNNDELDAVKRLQRKQALLKYNQKQSEDYYKANYMINDKSGIMMIDD